MPQEESKTTEGARVQNEFSLHKEYDPQGTKWWQAAIGYTVAALLFWQPSIRRAFMKGLRNG